MFLGLAVSAHADAIAKLDVTSILGPAFFLDPAAIGGGDFTSANASFTRNFGLANCSFNPTSTLVSITGIGGALSSATPNTTSNATVTITYLGSNGGVGGGDDVLIGSTTDSFTSTSGAGEYAWKFTTPLTATFSSTLALGSSQFVGLAVSVP